VNVEKPTVSVVIPTHDRGDVIGRAVASVLHQDAGDLEVIVVDDASTDDTAAVVAAITDPRVHYVAGERVGAAEARNIGARRARGRWLTFLDSDDTVATDWISSLLAETAPPRTALVSCGYAERLEGSEVVRRTPLPHPLSPAIGPIVGLIETGGSYLLDRELFLEIGGFDPEQRAAQHLELALRLGPELGRRDLRCGVVMRPLVHRWIGRGDNIRADDDAVLAGSVRIIERHRDRLALDPPMLANTAATASHRALRLGRTAQARRLALLAVRTRPTNARHWARLAALAAPRVARRRALGTAGGQSEVTSTPGTPRRP
jgi:glycosyltransferase involved in cell wall biosynthesis